MDKKVPRDENYPGICWEQKCPTGTKLSWTKVIQWERKSPGTELFPPGRAPGRAPGIHRPVFISLNISRLDSGALEIYRERYSRWNYLILEKVYIILLLDPKKIFFPGTVAITSVQQSWKNFLKKVVYFYNNYDTMEI